MNEQKTQLKVNKNEAIEFYIIGLTNKIAVLETKKIEILMDTKEDFEKNAIKLLFGDIELSSLDNISTKIAMIEEIDCEIKKIDEHIKNIIKAYKEKREDEIIFE